MIPLYPGQMQEALLEHLKTLGIAPQSQTLQVLEPDSPEYRRLQLVKKVQRNYNERRFHKTSRGTTTRGQPAPADQNDSNGSLNNEDDDEVEQLEINAADIVLPPFVQFDGSQKVDVSQ